MTDPVVSIEPTELSVEPGGQGRLTVTITNGGTIVENYRVEVVAEEPGAGPAAWAQCYPEEVSVYPRETGTATIVLAPPADAASGRVPFGVMVSSTVPPHASTVAEGDIEVGRQHGLQAAITPTNSRGRWRGRHLVSYTNWGNAPVHLRLSASDPDQRLGFLLRPEELFLPLGGNGSARLIVRTRKPFLRGSAQRLPFEVVAEPDEPAARPQQPPAFAMPNDPRRPVLSAALTQKPILTRFAVGGGILAIAAVVAAAVLAFKIPKPHKDTAVPANLPHPPSNVHAKLTNDTTATITWDDDQNGAHQIKQLVKGRVAETYEVKTGVQLFEVAKLEPGTRYCFVVIAVGGDKLVSNASSNDCVTTPGAAPSSSGAPSSGDASGGGGGGGTGGTGGTSNPPATASPSGDRPAFPPNLNFVLFIVDFDHADKPADGRATALRAAAQYAPNGLFFTGDYATVAIAGLTLQHPLWGAYAGPYPTIDAARTAQKDCSAQLQPVSLKCYVAQVGPRK